MKFIQKHRVDPKKQMFWEWALSDLAGSKYSLALLNYCKAKMPKDLRAGAKKAFFLCLERNKEQLTMYAELTKLDKENTKGVEDLLFSSERQTKQN